MKLSEEELHRLLVLGREATARPWYVRRLDDDFAMNLVAISTSPDTEKHERWPDFDSGEMIAATLVQEPRYVSAADGKWHENASYIVAAANSLLDLIEEVLELRRERGGKPEVDG